MATISRPLRTLVINLTFVMLSVFCALLLVEITLRIIFGSPISWQHPQAKHQATPWGYKLTPMQEGFTGGGWLKSNPQGFRDRDWSQPKLSTQKRVMLIGDSVTFGHFVDQDKTFAAQLGKLLPSTMQVLNAGIGGWNTWTELGFLQQEGLGYQVDLILVMFYINDFESRPKDPHASFKITAEGRIDGRPAWAQFIPYDWIFFVKRSALISFVRMRLDNYFSNSDPSKLSVEESLLENKIDLESDIRVRDTLNYLKEMNLAANSQSVKFVVAHVPPLNIFWKKKEAPHYLAFMREQLQKAAIPFYDLSDTFQKADKIEDYYLYPWDYHLSASGHQAVAQALQKIVNSELP